MPALTIQIPNLPDQWKSWVEQIPLIPLDDRRLSHDNAPRRDGEQDSMPQSEFDALGNLAQALREAESASQPPSLMAAMWLLVGDLERSHGFSQADTTPEGSYWHGIMHRREGDFSNAAYWFRRVGSHEVVESLANQFPDFYRDPFTFNELVRSADAPEIRQNLSEIQWIEWQELLRCSA